MVSNKEISDLPKDLRDVVDTLLANGIYIVIERNDLTEEELVDALVVLKPPETSRNAIDKILDLLVNNEKYELAQIVKTHIQYNYE